MIAGQPGQLGQRKPISLLALFVQQLLGILKLARRQRRPDRAERVD